MSYDDPKQLLIAIAKILERLDTPYLVTGGFAVLTWGRPRFTADIDLVIELNHKDLDGLAAALENLTDSGYIDRDVMLDALLHSGEFNYIDGSSGMKVDFWVMKNTPADRLRMQRRKAKKIDGRKIWFSTPEDLVLSKLDWYKQSQSTRHLEDIESVIAISGKKLDKNYLKTWAKRQGTFEILEKYL